ncbi:catechol 2,3-dioxygenase [Mycolicibacter arupensis]|uniref:Catechol 1,2-dioxygenase n=1 Tax=Mycolicibacter arupensis TaxID=342002 RepID=A0A0F5MXB0_9MYCO|nr:catechol 2,3-dioxygenase [Mycolicibacter arupensis]KKB99326.1 catechol 1,2-dioxygenase [Mycolicibacter arupensis]MCV7275526.1 catechol 2,3-dioxygenase [Mycolicibacter arupensis]OQZ92886.1 catechol 2,3-dioxygenase [Mycolicibacter arupensis]
MGVMRLGYVHVRQSDLTTATKHYSDTLGMTVMAEKPGQVFLKSWDEYDHHSVVLEEGGAGLVKMGYKCEKPEDIEEIEKKVLAFGCTVERMSAGENLAIGDGVRITLPSDHLVELYSEAEYVGHELGLLNPDVAPRNPIGVHVPRLDHAVITAEEPEVIERFFQECMGFKPAERVLGNEPKPELLGSFLFCSNTPHDFAVLKGPNNKLHHFAYTVQDWSDILRGTRILVQDDVRIDEGATQHSVTRGTTTYFFDTSGNRNEIFAGGYTTFPDWRPITWTGDNLAKSIFYFHQELSDEFMTTLT